MKIKTLFDNPKDVNINTYLSALNIEGDVTEYINPTSQSLEPYQHYTNIDNGIRLIEDCISEDKVVYILQDSDVDGLCSASIAYQFLIELGLSPKKIMVIFHDKKTHGLQNTIEKIKDDCEMLWLPDAGSNDVDLCKILSHKGIDILITDHHIITNPNPYALIINNQQDVLVQNKGLCGTGTTFKLISAYCNKHGLTFYKDYIDLVMLANIGDSMSMKYMENRLFSSFGLRMIKNPFLKRLCEEFIHEEITPINLAFNVIPKLNAVQRGENQTLKAKVFKTLTGITTNYDMIIEELKTAHNHQNYEKDKIFQFCLENKPISTTKVYIQIIEPTPYIGLIANKLSGYYNMPVILLGYNETNQTYSGSLRSAIPLKNVLKKSGLLFLAEGHECACGIGLDENNLTEFVNYCNSLELPEEIPITVLCSTSVPSLPNDLFFMSETYQTLWGHDVPEPTIHISDISINGQDIKELKGNGIKFKVGMVDFISFGISNKVKEELSVGVDKNINIEVIGSLGVNVWREVETLQVHLKKIELK